jgi:glycerophosphoryl diester phosphodiesterase
MKEKQIIGHRGAAGMELENTATSLRRAVNLDLHAVEFDVCITKDNQLVVSHDGNLVFMAEDNRRIADLTVKELKEIPLVDGSRLLTLREALEIVGSTPAIIEIKDYGSGRILIEEIKKFPKGDYTVASRRMDELALLRDLDPNLKLIIIEDTKPMECIHFARQLKLNGIGIFYWILNPLTYWYARRSGLSIYVYTVNHRFLTSFIGWLYPDVAICTNHPEWYVERRRIIKKKRKKADRKIVLESRKQKLEPKGK